MTDKKDGPPPFRADMWPDAGKLLTNLRENKGPKAPTFHGWICLSYTTMHHCRMNKNHVLKLSAWEKETKHGRILTLKVNMWDWKKNEVVPGSEGEEVVLIPISESE
jgi:hypothetical protein